MSKHVAEKNPATIVLEARAVSLAEHGQFPEGFGRHRAPVDGPTELRDNLRTALFLLGAS